ncbi:PspC domain-containing protein [Gephyromycinifex aptenodytis]|uniref:PspC domain-containing protein n=1 Tax=Gephyromycinifex aptenodytis TaxID=2716227 RepID=UPI0014470E33|nr:PspC domain-containing protein [Gephyromycinifex aptenodytis]
MKWIHTRLATAGFIRPTQGRIIGGVCAGVAQRYQLHPWAVRLLFMLLLLIPGSQLIIYPIAWVLMPDARLAPNPTTSHPGGGAPFVGPRDGTI